MCQKTNRGRQLVMVVTAIGKFVGDPLGSVDFYFLSAFQKSFRYFCLFFSPIFVCLFVYSNGESPDGDFTPDSHKYDDRLKSLGNIQTYRSVLLVLVFFFWFYFKLLICK